MSKETSKWLKLRSLQLIGIYSLTLIGLFGFGVFLCFAFVHLFVWFEVFFVFFLEAEGGGGAGGREGGRGSGYLASWQPAKCISGIDLHRQFDMLPS